MAAIRAALPLATISLLLAGCGALSFGVHPTGAPSSVSSTTTDDVERGLKLQRDRPQALALVVDRPDPAGSESVLLLDTSGRVIASTQIPEAARWTIRAGAGGAYWIDAGRVRLLSPQGTVSDIGALPGGASDLVVSPEDVGTISPTVARCRSRT